MAIICCCPGIEKGPLFWIWHLTHTKWSCGTAPKLLWYGPYSRWGPYRTTYLWYSLSHIRWCMERSHALLRHLFDTIDTSGAMIGTLVYGPVSSVPGGAGCDEVCCVPGMVRKVLLICGDPCPRTTYLWYSLSHIRWCMERSHALLRHLFDTSGAMIGTLVCGPVSSVPGGAGCDEVCCVPGMVRKVLLICGDPCPVPDGVSKGVLGPFVQN